MNPNRSEACRPPHSALYIAAGLLMPITCLTPALFTPEVPQVLAYIAMGIVLISDVAVYGTIISFPARAARKLIDKK